MGFEDLVREKAARLQKDTAKAMTPVTLSFTAGILIYVTIVLQGLQPPEPIKDLFSFLLPWTKFWWQVMLKVLVSFLVIGGANTLIFEAWSNRNLRKIARVLVWDGDPEKLSESKVIESLLALLDFPHRFVLRFIGQWLVAAPLIVAGIGLFYSLPWLILLQLALGTTLLLCLMSVFHYFVVKGFYTERLKEALYNFPSYYQRKEFSSARIQYRQKIIIYVLVLVSAVAWLTTHISLTGQQRSAAYEKRELLKERIVKYRENLRRSLEGSESPAMRKLLVEAILGDRGYEYLLDSQGRNIHRRNLPGVQEGTTLAVPETEREIMNAIPAISPRMASQSNLDWVRETIAGLFAFGQPLVLRVDDYVYTAFANRTQYTVTVFPVDPAGKWHLASIEPARRTRGQAAAMIGPVLAMFGVALLLSFLLAQFMQKELMTPLSDIIKSSKRVEQGELASHEPILADDETGVLAVHHLRMVASIKEMVKRISRASSSIEEATREIGERTEDMAYGSEAQSVAVEQTSAVITEMNQTIAAIAESVDTLASSAEESSASVVQMTAINEQVANSAENLSMSVEETTSFIQEMSASIKQVAENVKGAAEKSGETSSAMHEMRESVNQVNDLAAKTAATSAEVNRDAESGSRAVLAAGEGMHKIKEISDQAAEVIERLSKRAKEIGRILTVIEDVTEETNLLALNAAIIAAQAGEHGRGFAVVADEIKDLAERTQASTAEIAQQILAVQKDAQDAVTTVRKTEQTVEEGVNLSAEAGAALAKIRESAKKSLDMAKRISDATREQSRQADQVLSFFETISHMIDQIHTATQEQTRGTEQVLKAAEKMRNIATQVKKATREQAMGSKQISNAIEHITEIAAYINNSQGEQKKAAQQVLEAITQISDIAHRNVKGVEKVSQSVDKLRKLAEEFQSLIQAFCLEEHPDEEKKTIN